MSEGGNAKDRAAAKSDASITKYYGHNDALGAYVFSVLVLFYLHASLPDDPGDQAIPDERARCPHQRFADQFGLD